MRTVKIELRDYLDELKSDRYEKMLPVILDWYRRIYPDLLAMNVSLAGFNEIDPDFFNSARFWHEVYLKKHGILVSFTGMPLNYWVYWSDIRGRRVFTTYELDFKYSKIRNANYYMKVE